MAEEIKAKIIIEMMGRPAEHLEQALKDLLKKLGEEKGVKIADKKVHKPKIVDQKDKEGKPIKFEKGREVFSSFAEVELDLKDLFDLIRLIFSYMPSHIEIIRPSELRMPNFDLAAILTEITKKLHQYDAIAKNAIMQNQTLVGKIMQLEQQLGIGTGAMPDVPVKEKKKPAKKKKGKKKK